MKLSFTPISEKIKTYCRIAIASLSFGLAFSDASAGVVVTIPATPGTDTTFFSPTNRKVQFSGCRMLFTASEIGTTGTITAIAFQKASGPTTINVNYIDIFMRETTASTVGTSLPSTFPTGYTKVYTSSYIDNSMTSGWTTVNLSTTLGEIMTFSGGSNNLEIIVTKSLTEMPTSTDFPIYNCHTASGPMNAYYTNTGTKLETTKTLTATTTKRPNIQLTLENTCSGKPATGTISSPATAVCSGTSFTLSPTGLTLGTGMHYQWQSRNASSGSFSNISASDTFTTLTTSTTINKDYRIVSACVLSGQSDTSAGFTVTVVNPTTISAASDTTFCIGGNVILTTPTTSGVTYTWFNGATSTGITGSSYTASTSGTFSVRASTSSCTGLFSNSKTVTVNPLPTATVTALSSTTFCDGSNVVLQASTGTGYTYQWQKGTTDITSATASTFGATTSGSYRVKIRNSITGCVNTSSAITVTVNPMPATPVISGAGGKTSYCSSDNLVLSSIPTTGVTYQWEKTSGIISGATSNSYTATTPDTYILNATLGSCSIQSNALTITENPLPPAVINPVGSVSFCNGDSLNVKATISSGVSYEWYEGTTLITGATTPSIYVKTAGVYKVKVTNTTTGCNDQSSTLTVNIITPTVPTIAALGPTSFCVGGDVTLEATVGTGLTTQWQRFIADIPGETAVTTVISASGDYRMKVTNGVGCAAYSDPITVKVNGLPDNSITVTGGTDICNGESSVILAPVKTGYTYQWRNLGVDIPGETSNPFYAKAVGTYSVQIVDSNGCESVSSDVPVTVKFVKTFYISPYGNTFFCEGESTMLATQAGFTSYQWYLDGAYIPGATDTFVYAKKNGKYSVKVQDPTNGCFATSSGFNILVIAAPDTPYITQVGSRLSTSVKDVTYQWYKDGVAIAGATDSFINITDKALYAVVVTNISDCSKRAELDLRTTGIDNAVSKTYYIKVFPNPTQDKLNVDAPKGITVSLIDLQGRMLFQQKEAKQIDMSNYAAGIYIIQFTDEQNQVVATEKVSKSGL